MNKDTYPFRTIIDDFVYLFVSEGIHGIIDKGVLIEAIPEDKRYWFKSCYNLGLGDVTISENGWKLDDSVRSGNGDMPKIIATVARIAMDFLTKPPNSTLSFQGYLGSKSARQGKNHRNILYQRAINSNWEALSAEFSFWGVNAGQIEEYVVGKVYDQIFVKYR
ncbi:hypothetical protein SAMN04487996_103195 [Dyadobacter soli]|uniref:Uncharacterized protein n=1 Tax=Dyadobacter soli TaxID=659014 RepID=A0A1G6ZSZ0_9BACT|nr:hypothetical protein [Dyadobacter soli]SDE04676.1 hypothetical protein SAMN04487996_103195 [Dyadobacter soli]